MRRLRRIFIILVSLLALYTGWQLWDINRVGHCDAKASADCAIVLGAAAWHDKPSPVLRERLNHAIALFQENRVTSLILTGGYGTDAPFSESQVARDYCLEKGIPESALRIESESQTTLENLTEAKEIMASENWDRALVVSDPWHLKRALKMAHDLEISAHGSATQTSRFQSFKARAKFLFGEFYLLHHYLLLGK